jgi:L-rhamnonate dehydratase
MVTLIDHQANSPDGETVHPSFGDLFTNEVLPVNGKVDLTDLPGFGLELNPNANLVPYSAFFKSESGLGSAGEDQKATAGIDALTS